MKLLVLGATGGVGLEIIRQATNRTHSVTAFVRSPERLKPFNGRLTIQQGNLLDSAELAHAIKGHDAVLSGFGPRLPLAKSDANLLRNFAAALTVAAQQTSVTRIVVVSTAFLFKDSVLPPAHLIGRLFFPSVVADASAMERIFMHSDLDWTIVRPPQLTDDPCTGRYRVREGRLPRFGFKISRADVADCIIKTAKKRAAVQTILGASN